MVTEVTLHKQGICCGKRYAKGWKWYGAENNKTYKCWLK